MYVHELTEKTLSRSQPFNSPSNFPTGRDHHPCLVWSDTAQLEKQFNTPCASVYQTAKRMGAAQELAQFMGLKSQQHLQTAPPSSQGYCC